MKARLLLASVALLLVTPAWTAFAAPASIAGCQILPPDNVWNTPVDTLPVHSRSAAYVDSIGRATGFHADFGSGTWDGGPIGIPYTTASATQPKVPITFEYDDESDPGPYPIPADAPVEGGPNATGDRHILVVEYGSCTLYEVFASSDPAATPISAGSGAVYNLNSNALRPASWTSADAAGLPVLPGLARYDEVAAGEITHALRFTARLTQRAYVWPARHFASSRTDLNIPPMGQRFRLRASFDERPFSQQTQVVLRAMKKYGIILADNGSDWYVSGAPDERWNNSALAALSNVKGADMEAVEGTVLRVSPDSGAARIPNLKPTLWLPFVFRQSALLR